MSRVALFLLAVLVPVAWAQPVSVEIDLRSLTDVTAATLVGVRGDTAPLAWDRSVALEDADGDGIYTASIEFPEGTPSVRYKAVLEDGGALRWEAGRNRFLLPGRVTTDRREFGAPQTRLPERTVSRDQLAEDVGILQQTIQGVHPGLFLHRSEAELGKVVEQLSRRVRGLGRDYGEAIPVSEVYLAVAEALSGIQDGHTHLNPYNQSDYTTATVYGRSDRVPFAFRLIGDRMVVTADATPSGSLPRGTEILTLDGMPVSNVIDQLIGFVRADGGNDGKRRNLLQVLGPAPAEDFDILYSLVFEPTGDLEVTARLPDGLEAEVSVSRTTRDERLATLTERTPDIRLTNDDELEVRVLEDGTGYIRIGTFATFNMDTDYDAWLSDAFRQVADADRLVVDVRGNEGGMTDAAIAVLRLIITEPVDVSEWGTMTRYQVFPEALRASVRSWSDAYLDLTGSVVPQGDGTYRMSEPRTTTLPPADGAYDGPVAVLVDAAASSATFLFANAIAETGAAVLVGQETGGSLWGLNAGLVAFATLPHSGLVVDIPLQGLRPATPGLEGGVVPDIVVTPTVQAVLEGRDLELEAAIAAL